MQKNKRGCFFLRQCISYLRYVTTEHTISGYRSSEKKQFLEDILLEKKYYNWQVLARIYTLWHRLHTLTVYSVMRKITVSIERLIPEFGRICGSPDVWLLSPPGWGRWGNRTEWDTRTPSEPAQWNILLLNS